MKQSVVLSIGLTLLVLVGWATSGIAQEPYPRAALPQLETRVSAVETQELESVVEFMHEEAWGEAVRALNDFLEQHPDHLEARYCRAIARRERAKLRTLRSKVTDQWEKGIADFEHVVQRDSAYRDALYQYALFSLVQKRLTEIRGLDQNVDYRDAIRLGHAQVRHRPDAPEHLYHLFTFYRRYVHHTSVDEAVSWLQSRSPEYAAYFAGEALRLDGQLERADDIFSSLPEKPQQLPRQPVLLSRAKVHYALDQPEQAQSYVERAIDEISAPIEAGFVLEDFKYILDGEELASYRTLRDPEDYRRFFRRLWTERDPMPARAVNVRLAEHYRRLSVAESDYWFDGLRLRRHNPEGAEALEFPTVYALNQEFNDKGLIYIRHGEPNNRVVTVDGEINTFRSGQGVLPKEQSFQASWVPNESWRYTYTPMDFHFVVGQDATGNNWQLTPAVTNFHMVDDRETWGGVYRRMARAAREVLSDRQGSSIDASNQSLGGGNSSGSFSAISDFSDARNDMIDESREAVAVGLTTDRHTWTSDVEPFDIPHVLASFRGPGDQTTVQLHYLLPRGEISSALGRANYPLQLEAGYAVHDDDWTAVAEEVSTHTLSEEHEHDPIGFFEMTAPADSYHVALHGRSLEANVLGGYKFGHRIRDFSRDRLGISDLLLADSIAPAGDEATATRSDLEIQVNPQHLFSADEPLFVYFEIYQLTLDDTDQTEYTLAYTLSPREEDRGFFSRLFGGGDDVALSLENTQTGESPSPTEYAEIDVQAVDPGAYTLTVTVTDEHTGESVEQSRDVEIVEPE